ncbi:MAG: hypothetical protein ACOZE5_04575 [Verrucomicrobiota bacterium]
MRAPLCALLCAALGPVAAAHAGQTVVEIRGAAFLINGRPTYEGRSWEGARIEGLLLNARLVQGLFDDLNPATRDRWAYPDTGRWDPDRNTAEFIAAMPAWRAHGLLAFTLNLQGGSPEGYSKGQPWENSAFAPDGALRPAYLARLQRILDRADELGLAVILGLFYFGQDQRLADEAAVLRAIDGTVDWLHARGCRHVLLEINNECDIFYDHALLQPARVAEAIRRAQRPGPDGRRLLVSTSYKGGALPSPAVVAASDFVLLHGNGVHPPARIAQMVAAVKADPAFTPKPIVFNEDDHFDFDRPENNFVAALRAGASWGYFDYRMKGEGPADGFQSVPVDWTIGSPRKRAFFAKLAEITGSRP